LGKTLENKKYTMQIIDSIKHLWNEATPVQKGIFFGFSALALHHTVRATFAGYSFAPNELFNKDLTGKRVIITGANSGIGLETAKVLASLNANVVMAVRAGEHSENACLEVIKFAKEHGAKNFSVGIIEIDLASLDSVKSFVEKFNSKHKGQVDILINNAGIMMCPHGLTKDGIELQFGVNHVGHFLLTRLLLDDLKRNNAVVINLSSTASEFSGAFANFEDRTVKSDCKGLYRASDLYGRSKLANVLFTKKLQRLFDADPNTTARAYSVHPGAVATNLGRHLFGSFATGIVSLFVNPYLKTATHGAQTTLYLALSDPKALVPGAYYADCAFKPNNPLADNEATQDELWRVSEDLVKQWIPEEKK
jgi:retinol dehydrogenase-12